MTRRPSEHPSLAIIGMACRLPGADDLDAFWNLLRSGGSGIGEIPPDRLDRDLYFHPAKGRLNKTYSALGGLISRRPFDRALCPLTDEQVASADVAHLTLCEVAAAACRHAGLDPFDLPLRNTGVFVGHTAASPLAALVAYHTNVAEMSQLLREVEPIGSLPTTEREDLIREIIATVRREPLPASVNDRLELSSLGAAKLISRGFGLTGPFLVVDAACASSLQALAIAAAHLQQGRIDMAVVGGASYCKSDTLVLFSQAQSLSARGSRPFDADADGLILAEGHVALIVKTVARARADGDRILAVIRGIGMSTDGRGKSLWAPRKEGQVLAIQRAYEPHLDMARLQYVEAHATSTQIGDATELQALAEALAGRIPEGQRIPIGSVKANVGHTLEAAGLTGLVKTVLAMRHQIVPPLVNCQRLNPEFDWKKAPFFVPNSELAWPAPAGGLARRAAVNSFGIGGLNVHVVLDEFPEETPRPTQVNGVGGPPNEAEWSSRDAVAIVGIGCLLPGARTVEAFWELLAGGRDAKVPLPAGRWNPAAGVDDRTGKTFAENLPSGGFITDYAYDWRRHVVPPRQVEQANPLQFMLLDATEQALQNAGYDQKPFDRGRVAVVVGSIFGDEFCQQLNMALRLPQFQQSLRTILQKRGLAAQELDPLAARFEKLLLERMPALIDETGSFTSSTLASRITKSFDFFGGGLALDAGETSSLAAVAASADFLLNGTCDMVLCAAGDRNMGMLVYEAEAHNGRLVQGASRSPFNAEPGGSVPGEGVGVLLLKRLSDARRDGDSIRGILRGFGAGAGENLYQATRLAMRRALRDGHVEPGQVAALESASATVPASERDHARAIVEAYGASHRDAPLHLGSLSAQIGHTKSVAGMAALIKSTLALEHAQMPPEVGLERAAAWVAEKRGQIEVAAISAPLLTAHAGEPLLAAVTASTDDCLAYHVLLERGAKLPNVKAGPPASHASDGKSSVDRRARFGPWRTVRLSAASLPDLAHKAGAAMADASALWADSPGTTFPPDAGWRLAIVTDSPETLAGKLRLAADQLTVPQSRVVLEEQGIFCHQKSPAGGKVAFLFPGQGSQYAGMLGDLVRCHPVAQAAVYEVDAALSLLGYPSFCEITADADQLLGADVLRTQLSMLLADLVLFRTLSGLGVRPAVVSGHSYGEFAALAAAGAFSLEQAIGATASRCRAIDAGTAGMPTQMLSIAAPADAVRQLLAGRSNIFLSHCNAPDQTVVAGEAGQVHAFAAVVRSAGFESRPLSVPRAFHTPLMAGAQPQFARALERTWIVPPQIPVISSVNNRPVSDPAGIRANLVAQLTAPVNHVELVGQLLQSGVRVLVEVGPQQVLTRLHQRISGDAAVCISSDHPKRTSDEQLCRLFARLECAGANMAPAEAARSTLVTADPSDALRNGFVNLDATTRRKARLRSGAASGGWSIAPEPAAAAPTPAPVVEPMAPRRAPPVAPPSAAVSADWGLAVAESNGHRETSHIRRLANAPSLTELESFLVRFVIDQTGYPPEIVRLDADLEADLGIDSIKKAQLFGELREYFDITPGSDLRLDQFPTLRHVLDFLRGAGGKSEWLDDTVPLAPAPAPSVLAAPERSNGRAGKTADMKAGTASTASLVTEAPAAVTISISQAPAELLPADGARRPRATITAKANAPPLELLERFLVQFVIDQTGYPPEIVKLDADLEADLGIDSIKKAQLFGELSEYFDVSNAENLRLDDFPTLGHVLRLLQSSADEPDPPQPLGDGRPAVVAPPPQPVATIAAVAAAPAPAPMFATPVVETTPTDECPIRLRGLTREAARQYGEAHRVQIRRWLKRRAEQASKATLEAAHIGPFLPQPEQFFTPAELEELQGLAAGAEVYLGCLLAHHLSSMGARQLPETRAAPPTSDNVAIAAASRTQLTQRLVLRMVDAPLPTQASESAFAPIGAALVLGDNVLATTIAARLKTLGAVVELVPSSPAWPEVQEQFEALWNRQPVRHLFITTAHDPEARRAAGKAACQGRHEHGVLTPFLLCQQWLSRLEDAGLCGGATLVAATALGCDFGFSGNLETTEGGAATGLIKSLFIESPYEKWTGLRLKVVDFQGDEPAAAAADAVFQELAGSRPEIEVGYRAGRRRVVRAVEKPAGPPQPDLRPRGTWVVTGGGRGIAAMAALALAKRFHLKLHLIGLAPPPDIDPSWRILSPEGLEQLQHNIFLRAHNAGRPPHEEWRQVEKALELDRTLRACAAAGVAATYHSCDVSAWDDLERVLDRIRDSDGPIEGILHGAGIVHDAAFRRKKAAHVRQTFAAKNVAATTLIELTRNDPLRHFIAFGSVSGRLGMIGQADYSSANDLLCKQIDRLRRLRPECRSVGIHWHAWGETGLASLPELEATFASFDFKFMPPVEGLDHLIRELECGVPESEVMFTSAEFCRKQYPLPFVATPDELQEMVPAAGMAATATPQANGDSSSSPRSLPVAPLIESVLERHALEQLTAGIRLDPARDPFLAEHLLAGKPLLPFVMGIESLAQGARLLSGAAPIALENIQVQNGVSFADAQPLTALLHVQRTASGRYASRLTREFRDREGRLVDPARPCVAAEVECGPPVALTAQPVGTPPVGWFAMSYPDDAPVYHGPKLRRLEQLAIQYDGAFGRIVAPALDELGGARAKTGWIVPAAALDACLMLCSTFAFFQFGRRFEIPAGLAQLRLGRQPRPGETCLVRMYFQGQDARTARYDFRLMGENGDCLLTASGYQTTVIAATP